jgi:hypothetical protein
VLISALDAVVNFQTVVKPSFAVSFHRRSSKSNVQYTFLECRTSEDGGKVGAELTWDRGLVDGNFVLEVTAHAI